MEIPDKTETFCQEQGMHILRSFSTSTFPNLVEVYGKQYQFHQENASKFERRFNVRVRISEDLLGEFTLSVKLSPNKAYFDN